MNQLEEFNNQEESQELEQEPGIEQEESTYCPQSDDSPGDIYTDPEENE